MTLGSTQGVTDHCGCTDSDLIDRKLTVARAHLDNMLAKAGLTAPSTDALLSDAVDLLAAAAIARKPGAVDPRTNYEVDGFKRTDKSLSQPEEYADQAKEIISDYIAANLSTSPFPGISVVGRKGQRIGEYEEMDEGEEDEY